MLQGQQATVAAGGRNGLAINPPCFLGKPFDEAGTITDLSFGFVERLALLASHDQRQVIEIIEHGLIPTLQQRRALRSRASTPSWPSALGSFDGQSSLRALHGRDPRQALACGGIDDIQGGGIIGTHPLAVDVREFC
ncbi:hypothetical protein D3C71_1275200 [compost metagenome]